MSEITRKEAILKVCTKLGFASSRPGKAFNVRRLDRPGESYYLVLLGLDEATVAVATVDPNTAEIGISALLPGVAPHLSVDAKQAEASAAEGISSKTELVWMPCEASKSPLYPLWEVKNQMGVKYVDQQGKVWQELQPGQPGG